MHIPFKIIESKTTMRKEFDVTDGFQPTNALFYLKEGNFIVEVDGSKEEFCAGDCIIFPDYIHFRRNVVTPIVFIYIRFAINEECPFTFELPYGKIEFQDKSRFLTNIKAMEQLLDNDDTLSVSYREHLLNDILYQIYFEHNKFDKLNKERQYHDPLIISAVSYILKNINQKIMIRDICRAVNVNASTLNFKFRRETSMSIGQFIINERMKKARHLVAGTTYSLSEIATRCGFENVYYFSNSFKKYYGISPSVYRK